MAVRMCSYDVLTEEQKRILRRFYDEGMTSVERSKHDMIRKAAEEIGISFEKVKKWIGNERKKRKLENMVEGSIPDQSSSKFPPAKRKASGYGLFSSKTLSSDRCKDIPSKADKMRFVGAEWGSLSPAERDLWNKQAVDTEKLDIQNMTEEQKKKQISKSKKSLLAELCHLEKLGCEVAVLMREPRNGEINEYGSEKGIQFLQQNEAISLRFADFFNCPSRPKRDFSISDIQDLFNKKYRSNAVLGLKVEDGVHYSISAFENEGQNPSPANPNMCKEEAPSFLDPTLPECTETLPVFRDWQIMRTSS